MNQDTINEFRRRCGVVCNCAHIPPTIPTYRDPHDHLPDCPVFASMQTQRALAELRGIFDDAERLKKWAADAAKEDFIAAHGEAEYERLRVAFEGEDAA